MALWEGTSLNNNEASVVFSNMLWGSAISLTKRKNGLLYAMLGKSETGSFSNGKMKVPMLGEITGDKHEIQFQGRVRTIETVAGGTPETETVAGSYVGDTWGAVQFSLTHFWYKEFIPKSKFEKLRGKEEKTKSFLSLTRDMLAESIETTLANHIHSDQNQTEITLGGIPWLVDDDNIYGLNRADPANAGHQSFVTPLGGGLTILNIGIEQNNAVTAGGMAELGVAGVNEYTDIQWLVRQQVHAYSDKEWDEFGGVHVRLGPTMWVLDQRTAAATIYMLSIQGGAEPYWKLVRNKDPLNSEGIVLDPSRKATYVLPIDFHMGLFCGKAAPQVKVTGIS